MQRNPPFTPEYRSELRARLERLDQNVVVALSIRCALRVFPLLTYTENRKHFFNYWPEHRSKHILAIWRVLLSYNNNRENLSLIKKAAEATQKAHPIIESTIESVLFIAESNPYYSIYHAYSAAYSASPLSTDHVTFQAVPFPDIKAELELDLAILEAGEVITLTGLPLWQKPNSDYINWLEKHLPDALNQLSSEQDKRLTSSTLNNIWPIYKGIFDGKPDKKAIDNALNQLEEYFSNKGIDETENNKLFYGKDDEPFYGKDDELFYKRKNEPNSETEPEETKYGIETIAGNRHSSHQYAAEDKLNRQHLVNTLATLLQDQNNHHHQTIGLLGHWGVGKTSFVELLRTALKTKKQKGEPDFLFAEFNAWEYEHTDNLQAG
ncbi:P-loop NTPase fold protein, partial [Marinomonas arctica]